MTKTKLEKTRDYSAPVHRFCWLWRLLLTDARREDEKQNSVKNFLSFLQATEGARERGKPRCTYKPVHSLL